MDYDFDSSDILFPGEDGDIKTTKLTGLMRNKVPESFDWAGHDLANTFNEKTAHLLDHFVGINQKIKIADNKYGKNQNQLQQNCFSRPLHTTETRFDEQTLLFTEHLTFYESEEQKVINGVLEMIQEDIEKNPSRYPLNFGQTELSWEDEIYEDYNPLGSIDRFSDIEPKLSKNPNHLSSTDSCAFQRNDYCTKIGEDSTKFSNNTGTIHSVSINRRQSSKISKITSYFKTRLENLVAKTKRI